MPVVPPRIPGSIRLDLLRDGPLLPAPRLDIYRSKALQRVLVWGTVAVYQSRTPMKRTASLLLALYLAAPPMELVSAPELGTIKGAVTVSSRPISGVALAFVDLASGNIYRAKSEEAGTFQARVPAGRYVLTTENGAGLAVGRAPSLIAVTAGQVAMADVDLAPIAGASVAQSQEPSSTSTGNSQVPAPGAPNSTNIR